MRFDEYCSIFTGITDDVIQCPISGCRYMFAPDLENVAVEKHQAAHSRQEWDEVLRILRGHRDDAVAKHDADLAARDADIERAQRWAGADARV